MTQFIRKEQTLKDGEATKIYPQNFTMVKNYRGGISVFLEPFDLSAPGRTISMRYDKEFQVVPTKWALGVFTTDGALNQLDKGYIAFKDLDLLIELAESEGLYVPDSIKDPKITIKEMRKALIKNDLSVIKTLMGNANGKLIRDFVGAARAVREKLNYGTINYIKETYSAILDDVDLDG